jgi:hypothetical protein
MHLDGDKGQNYYRPSPDPGERRSAAADGLAHIMICTKRGCCKAHSKRYTASAGTVYSYRNTDEIAAVSVLQGPEAGAVMSLVSTCSNASPDKI